MSQSVERALDLLESVRGRPRSLDELASEFGIHKTTVLRLLRTLETRGFVRHDESHRYGLGTRVFEIAADALADREILPTSRKHLELLNRTTGQTVHLAVLNGTTAVYIDKLDGGGAIQMYSRLGLTAPLHCTAVGKVLIAWSPERNSVLDGYAFTRYTSNTILSRRDFDAELDQVIAVGWSHDFEEHEPFMNCIAMPVRDGFGSVVAAVSISVPSFVLPREEAVLLRQDLTAAADAISNDLGYCTSADT